ncbi:MAG: D-cysteine desulfhydrase [Spirochaetes bacterium RIFOXYC1_FULL_54_7]|nr:MAG: D-cysteine desulfhydrase [Spirochaetes bacterium RIFOXYC1_FULL_54_7]
MKLPDRIHLANLPTRIEKLERISKQLGGPDIYIKRDDQTGTEVSGNKIRKLEFSIKEALDQGCDTLITCGGPQSNHCRATVAAAARLGLGCILLLREDDSAPQGNLLLDRLLGAEVRMVTADDFESRRDVIMAGMLEELSVQGHKGYMIPLGASNGIGSFGYFACMHEIAEQEKQLGFQFDRIVLAVGSGGTFAGLYFANRLMNRSTVVTGINVSGDAAYFQNAIHGILKESFTYTGETIECQPADFEIIDGYVGRGYALNQPEELRFIAELAALEGLILDPVYTGKAFRGMAQEIRKGRFVTDERVLFIHTGGLYGAFPKNDEFGQALGWKC